MRYAIKALREKSGLTQEQLAKLLGLESESAVSMWETGNRHPRTDKLPLLAKIFNCSINDLFDEQQERPPITEES